MRFTSRRASLLALALLPAATPLWFGFAGEQKLRPGRLAKAEQDALKPGLTLRLYATGGARPADARRVRVAALHVPEGVPPSPALAALPFVAKLSGYLKTSLKGAYTLQLTAAGAATLRVNDAEVLKAEGGTKATAEPVELAKGYNRIEVTLQSPAKGDATVRIAWAGEGFVMEPLPPDALFSRGDEADVVASEQWREGRLLYATLGCAQCHELPDTLKGRKLAMPEMEQRGPSLTGAGTRLSETWMARWIADPRTLRPEARMPRVLHGTESAAQAADLAAYLASLADGPAAKESPSSDELIQQGEKTFAQLGCVACHHLEEPKAADPFERLSLFHAPAKFKPGALRAFLLAPHQHFPWIRMPDFKLSEPEAAGLTAFLTGRAKGAVEAKAEKGDAQRGQKLFREVGCANCHDVKAKEAPPVRLPHPKQDSFARGCLATEATKAPHFKLTDPQREALRAFLKTDGSTLTSETPAEFSLRQVQVLQCQSCHRRDGGYTRWHQVLEDEGTSPEHLPSLTWIGEKLHPHWTTKLLLGKQDHRARPWLKARMPAFPARAELLAAGLSHEHGYAVKEDHRPAHDAKLAEVGKKLIEQQGGFNCVMCHAVGDRKAVAPFEAPGINLLDAALRLRYDYYPRWMMDPPRVDITTRMPKFSTDGKTTPIREVFGGDGHRQYDAIWHYMQTLPPGARK